LPYLIRSGLLQKKEKARAPASESCVQNGHAAASSGQALLQHTGNFDYGCFLSDLTGFADIPLSRTQPSAPLTAYLTKRHTALGREFNLAEADCELQDTADFPSSAGKIIVFNVMIQRSKPSIRAGKLSNGPFFSSGRGHSV
jgi:hypothetical protein